MTAYEIHLLEQIGIGLASLTKAIESNTKAIEKLDEGRAVSTSIEAASSAITEAANMAAHYYHTKLCHDS